LIVERTQQAARVTAALAELYPDAECELDYRSPWELLVATMLSAQSTDVRVNQVTPELFARWPGPTELASAPRAEVEEQIRSIGMYRTKASSLQATARFVVEHHGGSVPADMEHLVSFPGVGRKTAKVVLGEGFGVAAGVTVDTHVRRLARRLGLTEAEDPEKIAGELESLIPRNEWIKFSTRLILHGRRVCGARSPRCDECSLRPLCPQVGVER
jgi:endonuclease-3